MPEALIEYSEVGKVFETRRGVPLMAVEDFNFTVHSGEFLSIIGPSGCGKTTVLRMTAGLTRPTKGTISVDGQEVTGPNPTTGIMFQAPVLLAWRTVLRNVLLPIELAGKSPKHYQDRAMKLLAMVGLEAFADHYPHELSGGMQQRVAVARALLHDPHVLLLDEPFGSLDALTREDMNLELTRVWDQSKKTAILVTHSISEAVFLADRVVVLSGRPGRIESVLAVPFPRPRNPDVKYDADFNALVAEIAGAVMQRPARTRQG
jgi:NitT/TauT family transport system ATP-binding protein